MCSTAVAASWCSKGCRTAFLGWRGCGRMEYTLVDLWNGQRRRLGLCSISFANQRDRLASPFCHGVGSWSEPSHGWATTVASLGTTRSIHARAGLDQNRHDPPYGAKARLSILRQVLSSFFASSSVS